MSTRFLQIESLQEFKSRLVYREKEQNIKLVQGLEEFVEYVIANGDEDDKFAIGIEQPHEFAPFAGRSAPGSVKTLVYSLSDRSLLLCLLDNNKYLNVHKVEQLYKSVLKKATEEDLHDLGMVAGACHGFISSDNQRNWHIVVDDGISRHPIYEANTFQKQGAIYASTPYFTKIMQARFPDRVIRENISTHRI